MKSKQKDITPNKKLNSAKQDKKAKNVKKLLKCSKRKVIEAIDLLRERAESKREQKIRLPKCKVTDESTEGILPISTTYLAIQLRNALITHNWEVAARLLYNMLKNPIPQLYKHIWRSYLLIIQNLPHDGDTRMERFKEMCSTVLKEKDFFECFFMPEMPGEK